MAILENRAGFPARFLPPHAPARLRRVFFFYFLLHPCFAEFTLEYFYSFLPKFGNFDATLLSTSHTNRLKSAVLYLKIGLKRANL